MNLLPVHDRIRQLISLLVTETKSAAAMGTTDLNHVAEDVLVPIFRSAFGFTDLRNLNSTEQQNFPGIDLADDSARVAFQVTATSSSAKVKQTIEMFVRHRLYERYDRLIIYILTDRQRAYSGRGFLDATGGTFAFDPKRDILDYRDLVRLIGRLSIEQASQIQYVLEANLGPGKEPLFFEDLAAARMQMVAQTVAANAAFRVPSLGVELPIEQAWVRLRAFEGIRVAPGTQSTAATIRSYVEWHRLAERQDATGSVDVETEASRNRLLVIIGGPGSGKSTLTRRLAWAWSGEGHTVLRVSLRDIAERLRRGESFVDALVSAVGAGLRDPADQRVIRTATRLLADGLDEADPDASILADHVQDWVVASSERHVVVTSRPIGYDPAWFSGWSHRELLPLGQEDVHRFAHELYVAYYPDDPRRASKAASSFVSALGQSRTASIAARNPQLLGVLIALYACGYKLRGGRYQLLGKAVELLRRHQPRDRKVTILPTQVAPVELRRTLECLGWELLQDPTRTRTELVSRIGARLGTELGSPTLSAEKTADLAILFWEERGLLERLFVAGDEAVVFVHLLFRDYAAATYLATQEPHALAGWVRMASTRNEDRETLLLLGGTTAISHVIRTLLEDDLPDDPISTAALLAADVLGEAEAPPDDLRKLVIEHLAPRLASVVPMMAYQAGRKLLPLARIHPTLIGPIARTLESHEQRWTRENACGLAVAAGAEYVIPDVLLDVLPHISDTRDKSGQYTQPSDHRNAWIWYHEPLLYELIVGGAEYLLRDNPDPEHLAAVRAKYQNGHHSTMVHEQLERSLARWLSPDELDAIRPPWDKPYPASFAMDPERWRAQDISFLRTLLMACEPIGVDAAATEPDPHIRTVETIWIALGVGEDLAGALEPLSDPGVRSVVCEVLRGVIALTNVDPSQLRADAEFALAELENRGRQPAEAHLVSNPRYALMHLFRDWKELARERETRPGGALLTQWEEARRIHLDGPILVQATSLPIKCMCRTAALLLVNCVDRAFVREAFRAMVNKGTRLQLCVAASAATWLWGKRAVRILLDRLETNLTPNCIPLIKALGKVAQNDSSRERSLRVLATALGQPDVNLVEASLKTAEELALATALEERIRSAVHWWLTEAPRRAAGSSAIPPNAAEVLLRHLVAQGTLPYLEMCWAITEASRSERAEVVRLLLPMIGGYLAEHPSELLSVIDDVKNGILPPVVLTQISEHHPELLSEQLEAVLALVSAERANVRRALAGALGDGWAPDVTAEALLHSLLRDESLGVRDDALVALRRLHERRSAVNNRTNS